MEPSLRTIIFVSAIHPSRQISRMSAGITSDSSDSSNSILGNRWVDLIRPCKNAALQIQNLTKACLAKKLRRFRGPLSAPAMRYDLARAVKLAHPPRKFAERD